MKLSVITAVRNAAGQIRETLDSVATQCGVAIEHIIVDGASTDGTLAVIHDYGRHVARVISEPDSGIYEAFNKGLAAATGDVISFLNAGDRYLSNDLLKRLGSRFQTEPIDAVFGDAIVIDPSRSDRILRHYRSGGFSPKRLASGFMPAHPTLFMRRSVYERIGLYDPSYRIAGDFELCVRAFLLSGIPYRYLEEPMVAMIGGGVSNRGLKSKLAISLEMLRACRRHGVRTSYLRLSARLPVKSLEMLFAARRARNAAWPPPLKLR